MLAFGNVAHICAMRWGGVVLAGWVWVGCFGSGGHKIGYDLVCLIELLEVDMQRSSELVMLAVMALGAAGCADRGLSRGSSTDGSAPMASEEASSVGSWYASGDERAAAGESSVGSWYTSEVSREGGDDSVGSWYASEASREDDGESSVGSWYSSERSDTD